MTGDMTMFAKIAMMTVTVSACTASPDMDSESGSLTATVPQWPAGTWSCSKDFSGFHNVDIWTAHNAAATYTVEAHPHGVFQGHFEEKDVAAPISFDDTWQVSEFPNLDGTYDMTYTVVTSDGTNIHATGPLHGQLVDAPIILGFVDLRGTIKMPDGSVLPWSGSWGADGPPDNDIDVNFRVGIGGGSFQTYFGALCDKK